MNDIVIKVPEQDYYIREAFKALRANVQFCGSDKKVIVITSCLQNEGKSSISLQLAAALAQLGKKTILVDADMRKSVLVGRTTPNLKEIHGLSHFLAGHNALDEVINVTNIDNLHIIYAGPIPPNPSELLGGSNFRSMVRELREHYDYVIIDSPPLGNVIDSAVIARRCDGVIMVISQGSISYRFAQEIKDQIQKTGTPLLGVIMNKVNTQGERYGKYGKYGKYTKYYGRYENMEG